MDPESFPSSLSSSDTINLAPNWNFWVNLNLSFNVLTKFLCLASGLLLFIDAPTAEVQALVTTVIHLHDQAMLPFRGLQ